MVWVLCSELGMQPSLSNALHLKHNAPFRDKLVLSRSLMKLR